MTQQDLGRAVDIPQSTIARIETGTVRPLAATLSQLFIATGFRLSIEAIGQVPDPEMLRRWQALSIPARTSRALGRRPVILRQLGFLGVRFVVIGALAEAVHGVPGKVRQIEVCHERSPVGMDRLAKALDELGPDAIGQAKLRLRTETPAGDDYDLLMRNATRVPVVAGLQLHVASLEDLVRARVARGRPADVAAAAILRAVALKRMTR